MSLFSSCLLDWYDRKGRKLPWRENKDPYRVWVSEIMLQQTRIDQAKGYFTRFMDAFPTLENLAHAEEENVLKLWEGLGYYSRARNLLKGAKSVLELRQGVFPRTKDELKKIPGIGEYTSSAISAICFDEKEIALDGNLFRVYCRVNGAKASFDSAEAKKKASDFFKSVLPQERAGDFNQALMDLGETVCLPNGEPHCEYCPIRRFCKAYAEGRPLDYPLPKLKKEKTRVSLFVFLLELNGEFAVQKRKDSGLLASLYEFPNAKKEMGIQEALRGFGIDEEPTFLGSSSHVFSHLVWDMEWYFVSCRSTPACEDLKFVSVEDLHGKVAIPNAFSNFLKKQKLLGFR